MRSAQELKGLVDLCCYVRERVGRYIVVVEVGSLVGESTLELALHFQSVWAVDTWDYPNSEELIEPRKGQIEEYFDKVCSFAGNIVKIKTPSVAAAAAWKRPEIDLLYIDGDHRYQAVKSDLLAWGPHVKEGGFFSGHDYGSCFEGVKRAIDEVVGLPEVVFSDTSWIRRKA